MKSLISVLRLWGKRCLSFIGCRWRILSMNRFVGLLGVDLYGRLRILLVSLWFMKLLRWCWFDGIFSEACESIEEYEYDMYGGEIVSLLVVYSTVRWKRLTKKKFGTFSRMSRSYSSIYNDMLQSFSIKRFWWLRERRESWKWNTIFEAKIRFLSLNITEIWYWWSFL